MEEPSAKCGVRSAASNEVAEWQKLRSGGRPLPSTFSLTLHSMPDFFQQFIEQLKSSTALEIIAVIAGILSVWFSRKENILVYPVGLINTIAYVYISFNYHLPGEAVVNFYYTVMSIYGWILWAKKDKQLHHVLHISYSSAKEWKQQLLFFALFFIAFYISISLWKHFFFEGAIPWADGFASATAFTAMWLMAKKKVESWYWWILTNIASAPLYYVKGLALTSVYYVILLGLAVWGLYDWKRKASG